MTIALAMASIPGVAGAQTAPEPKSEVVILGKRADVEKRIDRKSYRASNDVTSSAGTAADVLNKVPSVQVDTDGNISLRGSSQVTVLIDGKASAQVSGAAAGDGLAQIRAEDIDRVEVITNPSAQFNPNGTGGVINIIMKKTRRQGHSGSFSLNAGQDGRYGLSGSTTLNGDRLGLSLTGSLRRDYRVRDVRVTRDSLDPASSQRLTTDHRLVETLNRRSPALKAVLSFAPSDRDTYGLTLSWAERGGHRFFTQDDSTKDSAGALTRQSQRLSDGHDWRIDAMTAVSYDHNFLRDGEALHVNLQRSIVREREPYRYLNTYAVPVSPDTRDTLHLGLDLITTEFTTDYVRPLPDDRVLSVGYGFERDDNAYDNSGTTQDSVSGQQVTNPFITNHFRYYQAIHSAYATYKTKAGPVDVLAGLRIEHVEVRTHQITGEKTSQHGYARAYPSLHVSYNLSDTRTLTASYSQRVSRPDPEELNPFTDNQDIRNLRAGNPDLKPQETRSFEAGYRFDTPAQSYDLTAYWRDNKNVVSDVTRVLSADVILVTKANIPSSRSGGVEFSASAKLTPKLSYTASGNVFYDELDTTPFGGAGMTSGLAANLKTSLDFHPTARDTYQINGNYTGKHITAQGYLLPSFVLNLGYKRQLSDNLTLVVTLSDALKSQKFQRVINTATLHDSYQRQTSGRIVFVGLTYTFGGPKKTNAFEYN